MLFRRNDVIDSDLTNCEMSIVQPIRCVHNAFLNLNSRPYSTLNYSNGNVIIHCVDTPVLPYNCAGIVTSATGFL